MPEGRFCISNTLPAEANADSARTHFEALVLKHDCALESRGSFYKCLCWFYPESWIYLL